jgi:ubiquinone biosynthesis protein
MLKPGLTPTALVQPHERAPVPIRKPEPPSRWRPVGIVFAILGLTLQLAWAFFRRRISKQLVAVRVRELLERTGGLWIKFGQLLSLRVDVFPREVCDELTKLQSATLGFPGDDARAIIEEELKAPIDAYFDEFVDQPFAAASIGQVHRARLRREQVWVAVKVQKPYSSRLFHLDLRLIERLIGVLRLFRFYQHYHWEELGEELRTIMHEELDFTFEASSTRRMRKQLKRQRVYVPKVFRRYSTGRLMVTEFVHGALMADYIHVHRTDPQRLERWLRENHIEPREVSRRLINTLYWQLFEDNFYHGDMHPGNIVLLRSNRFALIDFGTTNFTEREYLSRFELFVRALATRDYAKAADLLFLMMGELPVIDLDAVKSILVRTLRAWGIRTLNEDVPYHDKSMSNAVSEVMSVIWKYRLSMDWAWLRIHRATTILDASLVYLHPDINYTKEARDYFIRADRRNLGLWLQANYMFARTVRAVGMGMDIQERINEYTMFQGSLIRRHAQVFQGATNKFADVVSVFTQALATLVLLFALWCSLVVLYSFRPDALGTLLAGQVAEGLPYLPTPDGLPGLALVAASLYVYLLLRQLQKRLAQKDVRPHERVAAL